MLSPVESPAGAGLSRPGEPSGREVMDVPTRPSLWVHYCAIVAVSLSLTGIMALPVLTDPANRIFGSEIVGRAHDPFTMARIFEEPETPTVRTQALTDYPGALLAAVTGSGIVAYNLLVLATFPLAAFMAFLLARFLTGSVGVAWFAALFFAFSPFHIAHAAYHPHIAQVQWIPFFFWMLWRCLENATVKRCLALAVAVVCVTLSNFYSGLIAGVLSLFAVLLYWGFETRRRNPGARRDVARTVVTLGLLAIGGLAFIALQAPAVISDPEALSFPRSDLYRYSARWFSYLVPPVEHSLAGDRVVSLWTSQGVSGELVEQQLTLGVGLLVLAGIGFFAWIRGPRTRLLASVPILAGLGLVSFVCSLSPELEIAGFRIPRLSALLYDTLPMFRAYARFGLVVILAVTIMAGIGFVWLLRSRSRLAVVVAVTALAAGVVELTPLPPWRWRDVLPTTAHRFLHDLPADSSAPIRVLDCISPRDKAAATVPRLFRHELRLLGGSEDCAEPGLAGKLAAQGTTHLVTRSGTSAAEWLAEPARRVGLGELQSFQDATVYIVESTTAALHLEVVGGFYGREYTTEGSFRWMLQEGRLALVNNSGRNMVADLELVLHAFPRERHLAITMDGEQIAESMVGTSPGRLSIPGIDVGIGRHDLALRALEPAVSPSELTGGADRRQLTVALGDWRVSESASGNQ